MRIGFQDGSNTSPFFKFELYGCMETGDSKTLMILKYMKQGYLEKGFSNMEIFKRFD